MTSRLFIWKLFAVSVILSTLLTNAFAKPKDYFQIQVVDAVTGRGIPLVELQTTGQVRYYSDSNGIVAYDEADLMGQEVYFAIKSHGYEYPPDGFGFRGVRLKPLLGNTATIKLPRTNIAERLYRITGEGIYRDSLLTGVPVPEELSSWHGKVIGQDSVRTTIYRDKLFWIWGDTSRSNYPLGNFATTSATSALPGKGGIDPAQGVDLHYFKGPDGTCREMVSRKSVSGPGAIWLGGLTTLADYNGHERLIASYARVATVAEVYERGLVVFDDKKETFQQLIKFAIESPMYLEGHPIRVEQDGTTYIYCGYSVPLCMRVVADWNAVQNLQSYEGFTCLAPRKRFEQAQTSLERDANGKLVWDWKKDTPPLSYEEQESLISLGLINRHEAYLPFIDVDSQRPCKSTAGSVRWNDYRQRWIVIFGEADGTSKLGEIWFAEAPSLTGPWTYAKKIISHDTYSFYNPVHHAFFDQDGGRTIYLEGTYSATFSGNDTPTPRYDYNQIMYRLDLADPRLKLETPPESQK